MTSFNVGDIIAPKLGKWQVNYMKVDRVQQMRVIYAPGDRASFRAVILEGTIYSTTDQPRTFSKGDVVTFHTRTPFDILHSEYAEEGGLDGYSIF